MWPTIRPLFRVTVAAALTSGLFVLLGADPAPHLVVDQRRGEALVRSAFDAPRHVSYVGQLQVTRWGSSRSSAELTRIEHRAPADTRRTMLAPPSLYGDYEIQRGNDSWTYDVKHARIVRTKNPSDSNEVALNDNILLLARNYRSIPGPMETIAGRSAATVSLVNRYTGERTMRVWIDAVTNLLLAKDVYRTDGSLESRVRYEEIRYTNAIPVAIFATRSPSGYESIEGHRFGEPSTEIENTIHSMPFTPITPKELPEGFAILSADVSTNAGIRGLHMLYSDGIRNISLFENNSDREADFGGLTPIKVRLENHDAYYVKDGPTTLLAWREHGLAFALVGDLDIKEMLAIAASVVP
jgi:negative regulator of sigma E activity